MNYLNVSGVSHACSTITWFTFSHISFLCCSIKSVEALIYFAHDSVQRYETLNSEQLSTKNPIFILLGVISASCEIIMKGLDVVCFICLVCKG